MIFNKQLKLSAVHEKQKQVFNRNAMGILIYMVRTFAR